MGKFMVKGMEGGLRGRVQISGAKNAALPILAACLLTEECCAGKGMNIGDTTTVL